MVRKTRRMGNVSTVEEPTPRWSREEEKEMSETAREMKGMMLS